MLTLLIVLAILSYLFISFFSKARRLPPGPLALPILGNLPQFAWNLVKEGGIIITLRQWQEKYGDVYTWWLGPMPVVNICDYNTAVDSMIKKGSLFADRPFLYLFNIVRKGRGIIFSSGEVWSEQRRFGLHTLRNMGLGKNLMQDRIMLEYEHSSSILNTKIEENSGTHNFDPYNFIELSIGNIINRMLFSERFTEKDEKRFFKMKHALDEVMSSATVIDFSLSEWVAQLPPFKQRMDRMSKPLYDILDFVANQVEERKAEIASGKHELSETGNDFVDAFMIEMKKKDHGNSFDEFGLHVALFDLWFAGQETTTSSLYWALSLLIQHQDEILRRSSIVPLNIIRLTSEDTIVGGHMIPSGTGIAAQLSLIMSDSRYFKDAEKFKPERFLGAESEQHVTPFGLGKRTCLGESLARAELYLFIGNLLLAYDIRPDEAHPPSMKPYSERGSVRKAYPFRVNISKRQ